MLIDNKGWNNFIRTSSSKSLSELDNLKRKVINKKKGYELPFLEKLDNEKLVTLLQDAQQSFFGLNNIILIGTGGSSLGAKSYLSLNKKKTSKFIFLDNLDLIDIENKLEKIKNKKFGLLVISKSGETIEVLAILSFILKNYKSNIKSNNNILVITENKDSTLSNFAKKKKFKVLDHPKKIGGRFSCFSLTGLLPLEIDHKAALLAKEKAEQTFDKYLNPQSSLLFKSLIALKYFSQSKNYFGHVVIVYEQNLIPLVEWYRQLWSESLGKNKKALHFLSALGPNDHHSQAQIWLGGPKNLIYTIILNKNVNCDFKIKDTTKTFPTFINNKNFFDISNTMAKSVSKKILNNGSPIRTIYLDNSNVISKAELMSYLMLEVSFLAKTLKVNPLDQPEVEKLKALTKKELKKNATN